MGKQPIESAYITAGSIHGALESIHDILAEAGLTVFAESSVGSCRMLYVGCPFLLLEALAFDRSTAVFIPAQVTVRPIDGGAEAHWVNLGCVPNLRLPLGANRPVNTLYKRISQAFDTSSVRR